MSATAQPITAPNTAQQVNTLLHALKTKQQPPFAIAFWSALQKIDFDHSMESLQRLQQLWAQLGKRDITVANILSQAGGANFILAMTAYIGETLAVSTGETITWYDFDEICQEINTQNRLHQIQFELPKEFSSSLVAKIGEVYCQPLKLLPSLLNGEAVLTEFVQDMQQAIFAKTYVNLADEPNHVARQYLAKVKTGRLLEWGIGFFDYLVDIIFDFSQDSLVAIDTALADLAEHHKFSQADYARVIGEPKYQAFVYLLGFYIGATACYLANVPSKWAGFDEMVTLFGDDFVNCIEHRFVQLMENHYRTPMLVVTNRLFGIAPNFPNSAVAFAQLIDEQNRSQLQQFLPRQLTQIADLSATEQAMNQTVAKLLTEQLQKMLKQQPIIPTLVQADSQAQQVATLSTMDNDTALDKLYRQLARHDVGMLYQVAVFGLLVNLPLGQCDGIALELRVMPTAETPPLALQLMLPYRLETDTDGKPNLTLYPLISNQPDLPNFSQHADAIVANLYQLLPQKIWQAYAVESLLPFAVSPYQRARQQAKQQAQTDTQWVNTIDLPLLPLQQDLTANNPMGLDLALPKFDYEQITWRGFDLPKQLLGMPQSQREYLQVVLPDGLIGDDLFSQVESLQRLYRYGKVVWGVVLMASDELYHYDNAVADSLNPNQALTADVLYDPTGQASVVQLEHAANALKVLQTQSIDKLPADQALYLAHQQDPRSRLFGLDYPASLQALPLKISSMWLWRRHLPNGILSNPVLPVMIEPYSPNQPATAKDRVMPLPARFWQPSLYQYWLATAQQQYQLDNGGDLMPTIIWQEQQGLRYVSKGLDAKLFPKFKFDSRIEQKPNATPQANQTVAQIPVQKMGANTSQSTTANPIFPVSAKQTQTSTAVTNSQTSKRDSFAGLDPQQRQQLQQALMQNQARLQKELSTTDVDKQRKLYLIIGAIIFVLVLALIMAKIMAK